MTSSTISTDVIPSLYYRIEGEGPAIVLLHGFPATGSLWDEVTTKLSDHFTVMVPDMPGAGNSRLDGEAITLTEVADAIKSAMEKSGIKKAVIAGHSMGGYIALALARKYPEYVAGLALVHSTATADDETKKELRKKTIELIRKGGKDAFVRSFVPSLFAPSFKEGNAGRVEAQTAESSMMPDATMIAFYTAMMEREDSQELISAAGMPLQWIMGKEDAIIPVDKVMQQTYLSDVNFISIYEGVGHMGMLEYPARLASDLQAFGVYCYRRIEAA